MAGSGVEALSLAMERGISQMQHERSNAARSADSFRGMVAMSPRADRNSMR